MATSNDSPLSITGSIVGIVALLLSVLTIIQALFIYLNAYRNAPSELMRFTSSVAKTIDENSYRLRPSQVAGPVLIDINGLNEKGRWTEMLQEYYDAHMELEDELHKITVTDQHISSFFNVNRLLWIFRRKYLDEQVRRVEILRNRKMAVALNALATDIGSIKDTLSRIEQRVFAQPSRAPSTLRSRLRHSLSDDHLPERLNLYSGSIFGESVIDVVRSSIDT